MSSTQRQQVNVVLRHFGKRVGLEKCELDERGAAQLAFDDEFVSLLLDEARGTLLLLASVGRPKADAELYGYLLDANLFWSDARGSTIARDPAGHSIVLQHQLPIAGLEPEHLEGALEKFVSAAEQLRRRLADAGASDSSDGEERLELRIAQHLLRA